MSEAMPIAKIQPRSKEDFYETFKELLHLTPANLDDKYNFYLTHPWSITNTFQQED
jgi:hypothetical protein